MITLETVNEVSLKVTATGNDVFFTKAGAFILGNNMGKKNYKFEKVLLGPQGNIARAAVGQVIRRATGENVPLMKVTTFGESVTYYAHDEQHVIVYKLERNERISIESENILAFTSDCDYHVRFLAQGVVSSKGWATSTLTGAGDNAFVAILVDGNPLAIDSRRDGSTIEVDPDAVVCWIGSDPTMVLDVGWKNLIGQASGESYMFEWKSNNTALVIVQPTERASGINLGMDGGNKGQRASVQQNQTVRQAGDSVGETLGQLGRIVNDVNNSGILGNFLGGNQTR